VPALDVIELGELIIGSDFEIIVALSVKTATPPRFTTRSETTKTPITEYVRLGRKYR
jgi:hypothetical protein